MKKYILTTNTKQWDGVTLYQIQADRDFGSMSKGDLGGYIEKEANLSHDGNAWVHGDAQVSDDAKVSGNALVSGNAKVSGNALVSNDAKVSDDAYVSGNAQVSNDAQVSGNAKICANASFTKGWFIGGDDSGKITDITDKTGSTYWKKQYVLGDYEITPMEEEKTLSGTEVSVTIGDKTYKAIIK